MTHCSTRAMGRVRNLAGRCNLMNREESRVRTLSEAVTSTSFIDVREYGVGTFFQEQNSCSSNSVESTRNEGVLISLLVVAIAYRCVMTPTSRLVNQKTKRMLAASDPTQSPRSTRR